ncbi:WD repeat-containing protein 47-like [Paramacrobiotus metropolitanus]|uniref:WD repeat-containing protein 47-like n=1 Tax=Paramacrobiotus metropolitanus TaxID=2943436 RepID=UPI00244652E5|nr:WD repeat-containing protein 47-like [Paramacrobiotus metropolitanus]
MVIKPNSSTSNSQVNISDREIIILILEFLESKNLNISQISLERETGIVNGAFSNEILFLRDLIIEGSWDDAVDYVEPLQQAAVFDYIYFKKIVYRYKYLELLCIKNEVGNTKFSEEAAVNCLRELETVCEKAELNEYRLLLSYGTIQDHPDFRDWNPSSARVKCFREIRPLVETVLQIGTPSQGETNVSPPDRLVHLSLACKTDDLRISQNFRRPGNSRSARAALVNENTTKLQERKVDMPDHRQNTGEPLSPIEENINSFSDVDHGTEPVSQRREQDEDRKRVMEDWHERDRLRDLLVAEIMGSAQSKVSSPAVVQNDRNVGSPLISRRLETAQNQNVVTPIGLDRAYVPTGDIMRGKDIPISGPDRIKGQSEKSASSENSTLQAVIPRLENRSDTLLSDNTSTGYHSRSPSASIDFETDTLRFVPVQIVEDEAFVRCAAFHPDGSCYAVGSNSKTLRICEYPAQMNARLTEHREQPHNVRILDSRINYHKGSLFCLAWSLKGTLIASGSNDKIIKLSRFDPQTKILQEGNMELRVHDDTIRDVIFLEDTRTSSALLMISAGADNKIFATDCHTATKLHKFGDHSAPVLSLHSWTRGMFVSGAQDKTCRLWDLRTLSAVKTFRNSDGLPDSTVTCVRVDVMGKVMATAHESGELSLWDLRAGRVLQVSKPHSKDIRGLSFSPASNFLLTASYDSKVRAHNLEGNLFDPLPNVVVASHADKVIQCHMHMVDKSFLTTSADKTCVLWAYPDELR